MRRLLLLVTTGFLALTSVASAQTRVRGYVKKNGTYVAPHTRSSKNHTKVDNYRTKGNVNPYTGSVGTKRVDVAPVPKTTRYRSSSQAPLTYRAPITASPTTSTPKVASPSTRGASALCRDGTYSYSAHRRGTCSHHGGVETWF